MRYPNGVACQKAYFTRHLIFFDIHARTLSYAMSFPHQFIPPSRKCSHLCKAPSYGLDSPIKTAIQAIILPTTPKYTADMMNLQCFHDHLTPNPYTIYLTIQVQQSLLIHDT